MERHVVPHLGETRKVEELLSDDRRPGYKLSNPLDVKILGHVRALSEQIE